MGQVLETKHNLLEMKTEVADRTQPVFVLRFLNDPKVVLATVFLIISDESGHKV
jgi:hypothetical protein